MDGAGRGADFLKHMRKLRLSLTDNLGLPQGLCPHVSCHQRSPLILESSSKLFSQSVLPRSCRLSHPRVEERQLPMACEGHICTDLERWHCQPLKDSDGTEQTSWDSPRDILNRLLNMQKGCLVAGWLFGPAGSSGGSWKGK